MRRFLRPSWGKLGLFLFLVAIMIGGQIQAWAFSDVPPKPPLYDLLRPFPIWPLWMILLAPLVFFSLLLEFLGIGILGGPDWLFTMANVVYFYLLSCLIAIAAGRGRSAWRSREGRE